MRKISVLVALIMVSLLTLSGCNLAAPSNEMTEQNVTALSIFSMGELLGQTQTTAPMQAVRTTAESEEDPIETETDPVLEKYLALMETYLNPNGPMVVQTIASDREGFAWMTTYEVKDLLGDAIIYTVYYNETEIVPEVETPETEENEPEAQPAMRQGDRNREHDDLFEDDDSSAVFYELEGLLLVGETEYTIIGRKKIEDNETVYQFVALTDAFNFIRIGYKTDEEGQRFTLVQRVDGKIVQRTIIKVESTVSETKVMLTYQTDSQIARYQFKLVENEDYDIQIKYDIRTLGAEVERGMIKINILVDEITGETSYSYQIIGERQGQPFNQFRGIGRGHYGQRPETKHNQNQPNR